MSMLKQRDLDLYIDCPRHKLGIVAATLTTHDRRFAGISLMGTLESPISGTNPEHEGLETSNVTTVKFSGNPEKLARLATFLETELGFTHPIITSELFQPEPVLTETEGDDLLM